MVNNPPAVPEIQELRVGSLGQENPLEKEKAAHSTIPAGITLWLKEPGRIQSVESHRQSHGVTWT